VLFGLLAWPVHALERATLEPLNGDDPAARIEVVRALAASGDSTAVPVLQALAAGELYVLADGRFVIGAADGCKDAISAAPCDLPADATALSANNRLRKEVESALAVFRIFSPQVDERLAAAQAMSGGGEQAQLPMLQRALEKETDAAVREALTLAHAATALHSDKADVRLTAVRSLADSTNAKLLEQLRRMYQPAADGSFTEPDAAVRAAAQESAQSIELRLTGVEVLGHIFSGVSLGSVLLLAALGLAVTFGLMGVINMAHGEMLMIGAYSTFVVQGAFRRWLPEWLDWYVVAALPVAFCCAALTGILIERLVIRHLYRRPLETLLATWGVSLALIQLARTLFGAQNVEVANPTWLSGGVPIAAGLVLPWNRIIIILFALAVLAGVWWVLVRTRAGLNLRAVMQNRAMADALGVPARRVDVLTFAFGSGIAGLGGVALSQLGNVGPELGQSYIIDSFLVVVLGGVGQLAGTVSAALGLGLANKFLEPALGAVLGKILILVLIVLFIQKRPQGLFALPGRAAEA
jgi:urea transport system permease protein